MRGGVAATRRIRSSISSGGARSSSKLLLSLVPLFDHVATSLDRLLVPALSWVFNAISVGLALRGFVCRREGCVSTADACGTAGDAARTSGVAREPRGSSRGHRAMACGGVACWDSAGGDDEAWAGAALGRVRRPASGQWREQETPRARKEKMRWT